MDEAGRNVTEAAVRLGCECGTLSRLLNGEAGVSANMALEDVGWGTANRWMQASGATNSRRRAVTGQPLNDARANCTHAPAARPRCGTRAVPDATIRLRVPLPANCKRFLVRHSTDYAV